MWSPDSMMAFGSIVFGLSVGTVPKRTAGNWPGLTLRSDCGEVDGMFDLYHELLTNAKFVNELDRLSQEMVQLEAQLGDGAPYSPEAARIIQDIFRKCDYNCGPILPYFFPEAIESLPEDPDAVELGTPAAPLRRPLSLLNRPFAFVMTEINSGGETTIRASRQVSKSTTFSARQLVLTHLLPGFRSIYVAPHTQHMRTYATKLREMERCFRYHSTPKGYRSNLNLKEYPNQSLIELVRVATTASDARGKTGSDLLFDEFQGFDVNLLPEVEQVLRSKSLKCKTFAGTSLTLDSALETKFQQGSMGTWHVRCPDGKHWVNCGDTEEILPIIRVEGPTCPHTGQILNMEDGEYVHAHPGRAEAGFKSYHIPQILISEFVVDPIQWIPLFQMLQTYQQMGQEKKWLQEVMGIPSEDGLREISEKDLEDICNPEETSERRLARAQQGGYRHVVSGIDWGGSDWNPADKTKQSYTVHVMLGLTAYNKMEIISMSKYAGMAYDVILHKIAQAHKRGHGSFIASDFSAGATYNLLLRKEEGVLASSHYALGYALPPGSPMVARPASTSMTNHYSINRNESITFLFDVIRNASRLSCYRWEEAKPCLSDLLNMYRAPGDLSAGQQSFRYIRSGSKPDDTLHALNFAIVLGRLIMGEPLLLDRGLQLEMQRNFKTGVHSTGAFGGGSRVISG